MIQLNQLEKHLVLTRQMRDDMVLRHTAIYKAKFDQDKNGNVKFAVGDKVSYYVGDRNSLDKKLKNRYIHRFL